MGNNRDNNNKEDKNLYSTIKQIIINYNMQLKDFLLIPNNQEIQKTDTFRCNNNFMYQYTFSHSNIPSPML